MNRENILYLDESDVKTICQDIDSIAVMREVFKMHGSGETTLPDEAYLSWTNAYGEPARSLNMPGYVGGDFNSAGTKIINANIANPQRELPRASGLTLLYDTVSARVTCIMEGAFISSLRTASVTLLATQLCGGREMQRVAIIGAGILARMHIKIFVQHLPKLSHIYLYDSEIQRTKSLGAELQSLLIEKHITFHQAPTAQAAIEEAQLIVPLTTTTTGYIKYDWLQPGALLVHVSLDDALPEVVMRADKVIVDDWNLVKNDTRRLLGRMYRAGQIIGPDEPLAATRHQRRIDAQLSEIVRGKKTGRDHTEDIILVNPFGLSIEDIALAAQIYQRACEQQVGIQLKR